MKIREKELETVRNINDLEANLKGAIVKHQAKIDLLNNEFEEEKKTHIN